MSNKPFQVEGVDYSPEGIEALRQEIIAMRDAALGAMPPDFETTVTLSHVIALLAYLAEKEKENR